jgi:hypothetical protein
MIEICHRQTGRVLYKSEQEIRLPAALAAAVAVGTNLSGAALRDGHFAGAQLRRALLIGADLTDADLSGADLHNADLRMADLRGADLRGTNLAGTDLTDADLNGANLRGAWLTGARLRHANLHGADLTGAQFGHADLSRAHNLEQAKGIPLDFFKVDVWAVLDLAPGEVDALQKALRSGRVEGDLYEGECACLVGTLANARGCRVHELPGIVPDSNRPAEQWFRGIHQEDTPENHPPSKITDTWIEEWRASRLAIAKAIAA